MMSPDPPEVTVRTSFDSEDDVVPQVPRSRMRARRHFCLFSLFIALACVVMPWTAGNLQESTTSQTKDAFWDPSTLESPPNDLPRDGSTWFTRLKHLATGRRASVSNPSGMDDDEVAVVNFNDESVPGFQTVGVPIEAAEALACRAFVINYVINATDGKDECDGLTKAYRKTCIESKPSPNRRRRLHEKLDIPQWSRIVYDIGLRIRLVTRRLLSRMDGVTFSAADAVAGVAFEDARQAVGHGFDEFLHTDLRAAFRRQTLSARLLLEDEAEMNFEVNATEPTKPVNLELPRLGLGGVSEQTLDIMNANSKEELNVTTVTNDESRDPDAPDEEDDQPVPHKPVPKAYEFGSGEQRMCCLSILNVYQNNCSVEPEEDVSDTKLSFIVFVMMLCCLVKSVIRHFRLFWLPEAAGCILVGVMTGYCLMFFPHHDISFDGNWFLRILVPPIIFEAALHIDKRSFNRHIVPILLYAVAGTLLATVLTALIVHRGTVMLQGLCPVIPYIEALTFGALISSIDPIAVLSVLSNMGMTDTDTIYVVIFGESLLNDGVAIVLFHTLVHFLDENLVIDGAALTDAAIHFCVVASGSLLVGVASGIISTVYFWLFHKCQAPMVEVLMFFCWALLPYYLCDLVGWSGIVAVVAAGFVMDMNIVGLDRKDGDLGNESESSAVDAIMEGDGRRGKRYIFSSKGHLSDLAKTHVGFVAELIATTMETAIFAYLGLFLFSHRYHWNFWHTIIALLACCVSRGIMIPSLSLVANWITRIQQMRASCRYPRSPGDIKQAVPQNGVVIDRKMQMALWFAGLRGAMSFALVEHIPMFDEDTREGTRFKPELKAMTSISIMFTVFVLGGSTFYMMESLGVAPSRKTSSPNAEFVNLLRRRGTSNGESSSDTTLPMTESPASSSGTTFRRARTNRS